MKEKFTTGDCGEEIAIDHLIKNGYKIMERNWRYNHKEIDIIATKDDLLIITEVKSRNYLPMEDPDSLISRQKEKYLIEAAEAYIFKKDIHMETRFDAIFISFDKDTFFLEHIEGAFAPTL